MGNESTLEQSRSVRLPKDPETSLLKTENRLRVDGGWQGGEEGG